MSLNKQKCIFCRTNINDPVALGKMENTKNIYGHYYCILLSATITQSGRDKQGIWGFTHKDILNEVDRCKKKKCCYCFRWNASLKCNFENCRAYFHLPCGLRNKISIEFCDQYKTYCGNHRKSDGIPVHIKSTLDTQFCVICYEYLQKRDDESSVIWAPCCKTSVFHLSCIRNMALNAGYYMKCPMCSNNDIFIKHLRQYSVFVPERDASWETENGAYTELLVEHFQCDADHCLCTSGRNFNKKGRGRWHILKCEFCGSQGIHRACLTVPLNGNKFVCTTCKTIEDTKSQNTDDTKSEINVQKNNTETSEILKPFENIEKNVDLGFMVLNDITNNNGRSPKLDVSGDDLSKETPGCSSDDGEAKLIGHWENMSSCDLLKQVVKNVTNTAGECMSKSITIKGSFDLNDTGPPSVHNRVVRRRFSERLKRKYVFSNASFK